MVNPVQQRQSLRKREQRESHGESHPYDGENPTEKARIPGDSIPGDSDNPLGQQEQREYHGESHPYDSDNPKRQRQSLRQREQREYHGESHPYDSENTFRYREYLPTARIPRTLTITRITCNSDNPYDSENTTENPTLTTVRIPGDSDNPYNSENIKRQREYLSTARTPARIPPLQLRESLATATIPTTMRIPGDSENPTDLSNVIGPWNIPGVDYT